MTSCREPPTKSNPTIVNQNPQQKINISNIKMISMMKSFSKQQNSEGENPKIVPGTPVPKQNALIQKFLKEQPVENFTINSLKEFNKSKQVVTAAKQVESVAKQVESVPKLDKSTSNQVK